MESSSSPASTNVDLIRRGIAFWNARDWDGAVAEMEPDIEWRTSGVLPGMEDVYHGHEGVLRFWRGFVDAWDEIQIDEEDLFEREDDVIVLARFRARGRDGLEVDQPVAFAFTSENGKLKHFQAYWNRDDAPLDARTSNNSDS
ncbi:MAG: SnoaL-like domain [Thermoleophilaceae bacterium]|nr:SnoaL-like domain [Thermoleophilaceae bacterium]